MPLSWVPSPDGIYRTAFDTTEFANGPAEAQVTVGYGYGGGEIVQADHIWDGPPVPGLGQQFRASPAKTGTDGFFCAILSRI